MTSPRPRKKTVLWEDRRKRVRGASEREGTWCSGKGADVVGILLSHVFDSGTSMGKSQSLIWRVPRWNENDAWWNSDKGKGDRR